MRLISFTLDMWLLMKKPQTYTRDNIRVKELQWHQNADKDKFIFSGLINDELTLWDKNGVSVKNGLYHGTDLLISVPNK